MQYANPFSGLVGLIKSTYKGILHLQIYSLKPNFACVKIKTNIAISLLLAFALTYFILRKPAKGEIHRVPALQHLDGSSVAESETKGRVCIVSYFQTWCGDCVKEQPELQKLANHFGKDKLKILMVSDEPAEKIAAFKAQFNSGLDFYHTVSSLKKDIGIKGFPTTYLLGKQAEVTEVKVEGINWYNNETIALISKLLNEPDESR